MSFNKKEFLQQIAAYSARLRQTIEAEVSGFDPSPAAVAERRNAVFDPVTGYEYFVQNYFPHYVRSPHQSELHRYLFRRLPAILQSDKNETEADAAPRGEAKSTLVTQLFSLWCIVTGRKKYIVAIMDSIDQAYPMLESIKAELEFNPRLISDFPEATGQGKVWQAGTIVTANGVKVQVAGSGKKLRGLRHGAYRPDLTVLDDIENDEQVRNPDQRDKLSAWLTKTVLQLGGVGQKYDVIYIGTVLHYDSVLNRTLQNKFWHSRKFQAVLAWPERMDLWERWENLYRSEGEEIAALFYDKHQAEMVRGAKTSWAARDILALMKIRARDGHDAFDSEYQNDPVSGSNAPFADLIERCIYVEKDLPNDLEIFGAIDPSMGKSGNGRDPSAILVGGRSKSTGRLYVLEAVIKKMLPDKIIETVIALQRQYQCKKWAVEIIQFQEFFKSELVRRSALAGVPVPAQGIRPNADKTLRIETLQPHLANGLIWLGREHSVLQTQLRHFPKADHDDGPDALHMLWMLSQSRAGGGMRPIPIYENCPY
ncbi:phage terminase large subunit [Conchiformibius steedae DSM 2580]|uniref:Phage terminase large subunit n=1 Tax=Conchiformibius steedae DSM 2580 TaxID=1121352 RepID=A0AAE9HZU0_9NEIS|nr:phage terminase large subunit [Conchiformibius steedae]QMT33461.1 phage terminase large subunit [Conchiformibius steedae]URD68116.1 phage terminase large subunit [Conchiformibius steedae DSM 2580]